MSQHPTHQAYAATTWLPGPGGRVPGAVGPGAARARSPAASGRSVQTNHSLFPLEVMPCP
jgi:hypothetical protein